MAKPRPRKLVRAKHGVSLPTTLMVILTDIARTRRDLDQLFMHVGALVEREGFLVPQIEDFGH